MLLNGFYVNEIVFCVLTLIVQCHWEITKWWVWPSIPLIIEFPIQEMKLYHTRNISLWLIALHRILKLESYYDPVQVNVVTSMIS